MDGGNTLWYNARVVFINPTTPDAAVRCPKLPLTEPMAQNCLSCVYSENAVSRPRISIGSPNDVPVPCAQERCAGPRRAAADGAQIHSGGRRRLAGTGVNSSPA